MPRACCNQTRRFSVLRPEREDSPERGVRTAESLSRSPSPPSHLIIRPKWSPTTRTPSPDENVHFLIRQYRKSKTSAEPSTKDHAALHLSRRNFFREEKADRCSVISARHSSAVEASSEGQIHLTYEDTRLDCPEELYNLTKLAEVSLAAAAGQLFSTQYNESSDYEGWPEQEYPEDLSRDSGEREEHSCPECGKRYSTSSNLARHRQTHRSLADKKARRCPHCDKVYVSMPAFAMHVRTHNQGCRCSYCGKCFSRPWLLQGHIRTHTGEKPFKCTICSKAFADKSNLRAHIQTHSNMKPHVCGRCGKAFALKSYLYKHEESSCMKVTNEEQKKTPEEILKSKSPVSISIHV